MSPSPQFSPHVALLRGINVGGKHKVTMGELAALFEALGCRDVRTYIQSGNVVFAAPEKVVERLPAAFAQAFAERFSFEAPLVLRSASELAEIAAANPFVAAGEPAAALHVAFLATAPGQVRIAALDPYRSHPDAYRVIGREIYLFCPNGMARSKLTTAYFDARLATVSTMRNWRTVLELVALTSAAR